MALVLGTNSYVSSVEASFYFENRIDSTAWTSAMVLEQEQALITSTAMIDQNSFAGFSTVATQPLAWPRVGVTTIPGRGLDITFTATYDWSVDPVDLIGTTPAGATEPIPDYETAFAGLPFEVQLLKRGVMEQAFHLVNNNNIINGGATTGGAIENLQVGDISIGYTAGTTTAVVSSTQAAELRRYIRPLLVAGGANIWFRVN